MFKKFKKLQGEGFSRGVVNLLISRAKKTTVTGLTSFSVRYKSRATQLTVLSEENPASFKHKYFKLSYEFSCKGLFPTLCFTIYYDILLSL